MHIKYMKNVQDALVIKKEKTTVQIKTDIICHRSDSSRRYYSVL